MMRANGFTERVWFRMGLKPALRILFADPKRQLQHLQTVDLATKMSAVL